MDSDERKGGAVILLGAALLAIGGPTFGGGYSEPWSSLIAISRFIPGLCMIALGAGIASGRIQTTENTSSKRVMALIAIAVVAFGVGLVVSLG